MSIELGVMAPANVQPQRVLLIAPDMEPRGTSEYTVNLAREVQGRGVKVGVFCGPGLMLERLKPCDIRVETFEHLESPWFWLRQGERFQRALDDFAPQLVHGQTVGVARVLRGVVRRVQVPVLLTVHRTPPRRMAFRALAVRLAGIIATTQHVREELVNQCRVDKSKIVVIRNGIDVDSAASRPMRPIFSGTVPVVGSVGPVEKARGHELFLRAASLVLRRGDRPLHFVVAGTGDQLPQLHQLAGALGLDKSLTFVSDFTSYDEVLDALDVVVQSSQVDVSGFSILEAMGHGRPVVAFNTGTACELVVDGKTGRLVPREDVEQLARAMKELTDDPPRARRMGQAARAMVAEWFNIKNVADMMMALWSQVLSQ